MMQFNIFRKFTWRGYRWYFNGEDDENYEIIFQSEGYMRRASAEKTVAKIKREAANAPIIRDLVSDPNPKGEIL